MGHVCVSCREQNDCDDAVMARVEDKPIYGCGDWRAKDCPCPLGEDCTCDSTGVESV